VGNNNTQGPQNYDPANANQAQREGMLQVKEPSQRSFGGIVQSGHGRKDGSQIEHPLQVSYSPQSETAAAGQQ